MLLKISFTINMIKFYTNGAAGSPSNGLPGLFWHNSRYFNRFQSIWVKLEGILFTPWPFVAIITES